MNPLPFLFSSLFLFFLILKLTIADDFPWLIVTFPVWGGIWLFIFFLILDWNDI